MLMYYSINTALVIFGFMFIVLGGASAYVGLGNHKVARDWFCFWLGIAFMAIGVGLWWLTGSVYPDGVFKPLINE